MVHGIVNTSDTPACFHTVVWYCYFSASFLLGDLQAVEKPMYSMHIQVLLSELSAEFKTAPAG